MTAPPGGELTAAAWQQLWNAADHAGLAEPAGPVKNGSGPYGSSMNEIRRAGWEARAHLRATDPGFAALEAHNEEISLQERTRELRITEQARRIARSQLDAEAFRPGTPAEFPGTLADSLKRPRPEHRYLIDGLWSAAGNISIESVYKVGKTTLLGAVAGSLADGTPFLGFAQVHPPAGPVAVWNCEMDPDEFDDYLVPHVTDRSRVAVAHLRGHPMPLLTSQPARDETVTWLRRHGAAAWMIDSWTRLCAWNGIDPIDNFAVGKMTAVLDEIKAEAGVTALAVSAHMPHAAKTDRVFERGIGAQAFSGWVDAMWRYVRDEGGSRFLSAEGRKVALDECQVFQDGAGRLLAFAGDRETAAGQSLEYVVGMWVRMNPGKATAQVCKAAGKRKADVEAVLHSLMMSGQLYSKPGPRGSVLWFPRA